MLINYTINGSNQKRLSGFLLENKGAALVEFAIVFPVFIVFIYGLINFGRLYWYQSTLNYAVEEGARYGVVNPGASNSQINDITKAAFVGPDYHPLSITITTVANTSITVSATYPYTFKALPFSSITLTAKSVYPLF